MDEFNEGTEGMVGSRESGKIAIISGDPTCYNALNEFALAFQEELSHYGWWGELINLDIVNQEILDSLLNVKYDAIVGFQTNLFTLRLNNEYVGNMIGCPKFNFVFDSPISKTNYFEPCINNMTFCYHDISYIDYVRKRYPHANVILCPPGGGIAGFETKGGIDEPKRYDVTFLGTYIDYQSILEQSAENGSDMSNIVNDLFAYLIDNPNTSAEDILTGGYLPLEIISNPFFLGCMNLSVCAAKAYYRDKVIAKLLEYGIQLDVFSHSWYEASYSDHPCLHIHDAVSYRESMSVMAESKISLNVFSWHKASITERIANIMLNGAVCVSDYSRILSKLFSDGGDIVLFDLQELEMMAVRVKSLLEDDEKRRKIALAGYQNASNNHKWRNRVYDILKML